MVNAPVGYGDLPQLARQALQPKPDKVDSNLKLSQAQVAHLEPTSTPAKSEPQQTTELRQSFREDLRKADPPPVQENPRYAEADVLRLQARLKSFEDKLVAAQSSEKSYNLPMSRSEDKSGLSAVELNELRRLQLEIRSLGKDISNISSALTRVGVRPPTPAPNERSTEAELSERRSFVNEENQTLNTQIRRRESAMINDRQRMLLSALRRVERKLADVSSDTKSISEHVKIIGDIYKVRFAIASFPSPSVGSMLGGMLFDNAA